VKMAQDKVVEDVQPEEDIASKRTVSSSPNSSKGSWGDEKIERGHSWLSSGAYAFKAQHGPGLYDRLVDKFTYSIDIDDGTLSPCGDCQACAGCSKVKPSRAVDPETADIIMKDVPRSFGTVMSGIDSPAIKYNLTQVLLVFSGYMPQVGYTQGMNFICAIALDHMSNEDAFWLLVYIVNNLPTRFFRHTAQDEVELFVEIVSQYAPVIKKHLVESEESDEVLHRAIGYLLVQWMVPLFAHSLPLATTLCVWDFLFAPSDSTEESLILRLHRVAFALLEIHSGCLLSKHREMDEAYTELNSLETDPFWEDVRAKLADSLENTSGFLFVQKILLGASCDTNPDRVVTLAQEVTIEPSWLAQVRHIKHVEKACTPRGQKHENTQISDKQPKLMGEKKLQRDSFSSSDLLGCIGVRDKRENSVDSDSSDDCVIS